MSGQVGLADSYLRMIGPTKDQLLWPNWLTFQFIVPLPKPVAFTTTPVALLEYASNCCHCPGPPNDW